MSVRRVCERQIAVLQGKSSLLFISDELGGDRKVAGDNSSVLLQNMGGGGHKEVIS